MPSSFRALLDRCTHIAFAPSLRPSPLLRAALTRGGYTLVACAPPSGTPHTALLLPPRVPVVGSPTITIRVDPDTAAGCDGCGRSVHPPPCTPRCLPPLAHPVHDAGTGEYHFPPAATLTEAVAAILGHPCALAPKSHGYAAFTVPAEHVFFTTPSSLAIVNLKPAVVGHVLVLPRRRAARLSQLTPSEVGDLFQTVHTVSAMLQRHTACDSLTLTVQDGEAAGQTVPHLHVHLLPRFFGDLPKERNDEIYAAIDKSEPGAWTGPAVPLGPDGVQPWAWDGPAPRGVPGGPVFTALRGGPRDSDVMAREAGVLRALFPPGDGSGGLDW